MTIKILVTAIGGGSVGEQILKAVKLSSLNYQLFGADGSNLCANKKEVSQFSLLPMANHPDYIECLLKLCTDNEVDVLVPGSEAELKVISQNRPLFESKNIFLPINPDEVIVNCLDKTKTQQMLLAHGFEVIKSVVVSDFSEIENFDSFPYVLKPSSGGGSANIFIAQDREELSLFGKMLLNSFGKFVLQEYVGTPDHEYTIGILSDMEGNILNSIVIRRIINSGLGLKLKVKNKTANGSLGEYLVISSGISQGEILPRSYLNEFAETVAKKIGSKAALNVQCRTVNGRPFIFEINPRFSGTSSLRALAGYNEIEVLIKDSLLKQKPAAFFDYKTGYVLRALHEVYLG